ncbi:hypothetical protein BUALT_Bualt05G0035700 [Buddleja alternifolia]|uniref:Uncharacterized protein n=1 Tax=Buddleja alternifolia TaxID=168488 RepID=A0AAV6XS62_9LAMI|nr:hypothetical protein BUALT_Bualt05G0035700 [Buddleja alternifolia]
MFHMIKISQGKGTFSSCYTKTYKYTVERDIGYPLFPSVFSSFNGLGVASVARLGLSAARVLIGQFDPITHGLGTANTSLALFSGHIFALCEPDLPYAITVTSNGDIITTGRHHLERTEDDSEMWWMDVPGFNLLHYVNAWEEDGGATVVMVASNVVKVEEVMENMELAELTLENIIINVKEKTMERHKLSNKALDFAVINPTYAAKKNR